VAGVAVSAATLISDVQNSYNFLLAPPRVRVTYGSNANVGSSPGTVNCFSGWSNSSGNPLPGYDPDGMWSSGSPSRLTVGTAGLWEWRLTVWYAGIAGLAGTMQCGIALNSGASWSSATSNNMRLAEDTRYIAPVSGFWPGTRIIIEQYMNAGDYVEAFYEQTSGQNMTMQASLSAFEGQWMGLT
jgi:hypothetical protein